MKKLLWVVLFVFAAFASYAADSTVYIFKNYAETETVKITIKSGNLVVLTPEHMGTYIAYDKDDSGYYFEGDDHGIFTLSLDSRILVYCDAEKVSEAFYLFDTEPKRFGFMYCDPCHGTGICPICRGTGEYDGSDCMACSGTKKCHVCQGTGNK